MEQPLASYIDDFARRHEFGAQFPALVLNADFQPLSLCPLSLWNWREAVCAVIAQRVRAIAEYNSVVRSPSFSIKLPSVIALKDYISPRRHVAFSRFNLFLRDGFRCAYCTGQFSLKQLTFDHVVPRRLGGRSAWENIVTACAACNRVKGGRLLAETGLRLKLRPYRPLYSELQRAGRRFPPRYLHESWRDFLYWDVELES